MKTNSNSAEPYGMCAADAVNVAWTRRGFFIYIYSRESLCVFVRVCTFVRESREACRICYYMAWCTKPDVLNRKTSVWLNGGEGDRKLQRKRVFMYSTQQKPIQLCCVPHVPRSFVVCGILYICVLFLFRICWPQVFLAHAAGMCNGWMRIIYVPSSPPKKYTHDPPHKYNRKQQASPARARDLFKPINQNVLGLCVGCVGRVRSPQHNWYIRLVCTAKSSWRLGYV